MFGAKQKSEWYKHMVRCTRQKALLIRLRLLLDYPFPDELTVEENYLCDWLETQENANQVSVDIVPRPTSPYPNENNPLNNKRKDTQPNVLVKKFKCITDSYPSPPEQPYDIIQ